MPGKEKEIEILDPTDLLASFLSEVGRLPGVVLEGALKQANNDDERSIIRQLGGVFTAQVTELASYVGGLAKEAGSARMADANQLLRISAAAPLAASGTAVAANLASPVARIGLSGILQEIKKILKALAEIFHIRLPEWFHPLLNLIDEILNKLLSVGLPGLARTLSAMEQDYLGELAQLARLQRESRDASEVLEEDR